MSNKGKKMEKIDNHFLGNKKDEVKNDSPNSLYEYVLSEIEQRLCECSVCLQPFVDPIKFRCEHKFCRTCVSEEDDTLKVKSCPTCRVEVDKVEDLIDPTLFALLDSLKVRCPNGCGWVGERCIVAGHVRDDCDMSLVLCSAGCEIRVRRKDMDSHLTGKQCCVKEAELDRDRREAALKARLADRVATLCPPRNKIVRLNVGGVQLTTSLTTLCYEKSSLLALIFGPGGVAETSMAVNEPVFLDCDATVFEIILNWLRGRESLDPSLPIQTFFDTGNKSLLRRVLALAKTLQIEKLVFEVEKLKNLYIGDRIPRSELRLISGTSQPCDRCKGGILPPVGGLACLGKAYHVKCLQCHLCKKKVLDGENYNADYPPKKVLDHCEIYNVGYQPTCPDCAEYA